MPNWTEDRILAMINERIEESSGLDWKRSDSLLPIPGKKSIDQVRGEIAKDVSAFANSAGGVLIYGVIEEGSAPHRPIALDEGCDPSKVSKELLDDIISSRIQPPLPHVEIIPVELGGIRAGKRAYVIDVEQ